MILMIFVVLVLFQNNKVKHHAFPHTAHIFNQRHPPLLINMSRQSTKFTKTILKRLFFSRTPIGNLSSLSSLNFSKGLQLFTKSEIKRASLTLKPSFRGFLNFFLKRTFPILFAKDWFSGLQVFVFQDQGVKNVPPYSYNACILAS